MTECIPCRGGEYAKDPGLTSCTACPTGYINSDLGTNEQRVAQKHVETCTNDTFSRFTRN